MNKTKKIWLSVAAVVLACIICIVLVVTLSSCKSNKYSATAIDTSKVTSNGGAAVAYDGYLYFVNGTLDNDGSNNGGKTIGSIYRAKINADGSIDTNYAKVVDALVGYENGSINIIGDFLYYTTPCTDKNKSGTVMYNKVNFMRYDLKKGLVQKIYTTALNDDSEEVSFAYYKQNNKLYLLVYEKSNTSLTSINIDTEMTTIFQKTNVTGAVFSEHNGQSSTGVTNADNFAFYTTAVADADIIQTGNKVYKIKADGSGEALISEGITLSLLSIRAGKLLFTATFDSNTYVFAFDINNSTQLGDLALADYPKYSIPNQNALSHVVSYESYEQIVFVEDGSDLSVLYWDSTAKSIRYFKYTNGTITEDRTIYTFPSSATVKFLDTYSDLKTIDSVTATRTYVVFTNTVSSETLVYKIRFMSTNADENEDGAASPVKLSTTEVEDANGNMAAKVIGENVYVFAEDDDKNIMLYRIDIYTPEDHSKIDGTEDADADLSVGKAVIVGGAEI